MPGPVSDSYEGPSDERPSIPEWALAPLPGETAPAPLPWRTNVAHHSQQPGSPLSESLRKALGLGPTGQHPQGKLDESDDGETRIAIGVAGEKVVMDFGVPTRWIGFDPEQALMIAHSLQEKANAILKPPAAGTTGS